MAYKFMVGDVILSGSLTTKQGNLRVSGSSQDFRLVDNANVNRFDVDISGSVSRLRMKNASGTTKLQIGSGNTAISGSGAAQFGGNFTVAGAEVKFLNIADTAVAVGSDAFYFKDADGTMKSDTVADLMTAVAGNGLAASSGVLAVSVDDSGIEINSDTLRLKDNGVTLAKMAGIARGSIILGDSSGDPSLLAKGTAAQFLQSDGTDPSYVSISGDASVAAGGALTIADNAVSLAKMAGLARGKIIYGDASGDPAALAAGANGKLLVADANGDLSWTTVSGDVSLSAGAVTIAADAVESGMLNDNVISGQTELAQGGLAAADEFMISDGGTLKKFGVDSLAKDMLALTSEAAIADGDYLMFLDGGSTGETKKEALADVATLFAGSGLSAASSVLAVAVSGAVHVASDKVSISGSIAGTGLGYTGGVDSISGLELDFSELTAVGGSSAPDDDAIPFIDNGATKKISMSNFFAGVPAAGGGIEASSGTLKVGLNTLSAAAVDVSADSFAIIDANDSNNTRKESIADLVTAMAGAGLTATDGVLSTDAATTITAIGDANATLTEGLMYGSATLTANRTWQLPASPSAGDMVRVKGPPNFGGFQLIVQKQGSHTIDGASSITLLSNHASVTLIYAAANLWKVF